MQRRPRLAQRAPWRAFAAACCAALACPGALSGCGARQETGPEPELALASSAEAQARFRALREAWVSTPLDARAGLERRLTAFVQRYPTDPQGRWVRIYLAWIAIAQKRLDIAERWLALAEPGPAGAASDLAGVVGAALELSRGNAATAYRRLLELSGKLIDADDRLLCLDQLVLAALADGRYRAAVGHMLELSAQAARRHRERTWRALEPRLASIPLAELEASLPSLSTSQIQSASVTPAERAAAVDWMRRTLLELLSRSALDEQNVALAQRLVAAPPAASDENLDKSELLLLATRGTLERTVRGRALGLALELGDELASQRSIDVATGISLTLDLPSRDKPKDPLVLVTRQVERGDVADAMARLAGDGASLVVAGFSPESARQASQFAAQSGMPVLLLHEPTEPKSPGAELAPSAFLLGVDSEHANDVLYAALEQRLHGVVRVGSEDAPCPDGDEQLDALLARASSGRRPRLQFDAGAGCARQVLMHLPRAARPLALGFGLDALAVAWDDAPPADEMWGIGAGRLPNLYNPSDGLATLWLSRKGRPPTWYEALGHDAALVASLVIGPAHDGVVRDPEGVRAVYRAVGERLTTRPFASLWTADGDRFDAAHRLPRQLRAERLSPTPVEGTP
jgi:hypothetical protein